MRELISDNKFEKLDFYKVITEAKIAVEKLKLVAQDNYTYLFLIIALIFSVLMVFFGLASLYFFGVSLIKDNLYLSELPSSLFFSTGIFGVIFGAVGMRYLLVQISIFKYRRKVALLLVKEIEHELE